MRMSSFVVRASFKRQKSSRRADILCTAGLPPKSYRKTCLQSAWRLRSTEEETYVIFVLFAVVYKLMCKPWFGVTHCVTTWWCRWMHGRVDLLPVSAIKRVDPDRILQVKTMYPENEHQVSSYSSTQPAYLDLSEMRSRLFFHETAKQYELASQIVHNSSLREATIRTSVLAIVPVKTFNMTILQRI